MSLKFPNLSNHLLKDYLEEFELMLQQQAIDVWFPHSIDTEYGGFLCDFNRFWKPCGNHEKFLEFQARQTLFAAEASRYFPQNELLRQILNHGFQYLRNVMWDKDSGGWFQRLDRSGTPLVGGTKHLHGMAYAIEACVAVYQTTGEKAALDLAKQAFDWIETYAADRQHGGYFSFLKRDGTIIREKSVGQWEDETDPIGTPLGFKDLNVHSDLLETFYYLQQIHSDPKILQNLNELFEIITVKLTNENGAIHFFCQADWKPAAHLIHFGNEIQTPFRLLIARRILGNEEKIKAIAKRSVDHALRYGLDRESGGFFFGGPGCFPIQFQDHDLTIRKKQWWVQIEALKTLLLMSCLAPDNEEYFQHFERQWKYLKEVFIDWRHGGIYQLAPEVKSPWQRWMSRKTLGDTTMNKGNDWKDVSHEGRAWLHCIQILSEGNDFAG